MTSGDIRPGDKVEITVVVEEEVSPAAWRCRASSGETYCIYSAALLASRRIERPLQVGDRVYTNNTDPNRRGTIKALDGDEAWVRWDDDIPGNITEETRHLTPAPASEGGGT